MTIFIPRDVLRKIRTWSEVVYPHEGCGLIIGQFESNGQKKAVRFVPVKNQLLINPTAAAPTLPLHRQGPGSGNTEFAMSSAEFNQESLAAERDGLDIVGILHTHPDHPPQPSRIDTSQPFLAGWSNLIVAVEKGYYKDLKSWYRNEDGHPFEEEKIEIID